MAVLGDRGLAALLSALAEAPDHQAAAAFLLAQVVELTGAPRAGVLRLDASQEAIVTIASAGFAPDPSPVAVPLGDLASPLVIATLAAVPITGSADIGPRALAAVEQWLLLPITQPRYRGALEM